MTISEGDRARCWVCASEGSVRWRDRTFDAELASDDLRITDSRYGTTLALRRCPTCGFGFTDDADVDRLTELYEGLVDPGYEESQDARSLQMQRLVEGALSHRPTARTALDVGAGTGLLVGALARAGVRAVGVEPSRSLVEAGASDHGTALLQGTLPHPDLVDQRFDLVFLVDVIEHVTDPVALLEACAAQLVDDGLLVVVTPDAGSRVARLLGRRWWHLRLAHVGYFTERSLVLAAEAVGLVPVHTGRAKWYFEVGYLADRVATYLPVGALNRLARRWPPMRWLYDRVIPLDLRDSLSVSFGRRSPLAS